jgi:nucleoid DNA-binding protein
METKTKNQKLEIPKQFQATNQIQSPKSDLTATKPVTAATKPVTAATKPVTAATKPVTAATKAIEKIVKARKSWYSYTDLIAESAAMNNIKKSDFDAALKYMFRKSAELLAQGEIIVFAQFGSFKSRVVHAREMQNLRTGQKFTTKDRVRVKFEASSKVNELLDSVNVSEFEKKQG